MKSKLLGLMSVLTIVTSVREARTQGYFMGTVPMADGRAYSVDSTRPVHIFVAGIGDELQDHNGNLAFQAAASTAKLYRVIYPNAQILIILAREKHGLRKSDAKKLEQLKLQIDAASRNYHAIKTRHDQASFFFRGSLSAQLNQAYRDWAYLNQTYADLERDINFKTRERYMKFRSQERDYFVRAGLAFYADARAGMSESESLGGAGIVQILSGLRIDSLHLFGHQGARTGLALHSDRLGMHTVGIAKLKPRFTADSFAILYGCNSALEGASALSKMWGIPVAGSLTATDMQRLHSSGEWYHEGNRYPKFGKEASTNALSFGREVDCRREGGCIRMKPDNLPYKNGAWGSYSIGLGFYKFFCNYDSPKDAQGYRTDDCYKRMARALRGWVSTEPLLVKDETSFRNVLHDFLCPMEAGSNSRQTCISKLKELENVPGAEYNPFNGGARRCVSKTTGREISYSDRRNPDGSVVPCERMGGESLPGSMYCDDRKCYAHFKCDKGSDGQWAQSTCRMLPDKGYERAPETTLLDEYRRYIRGFHELEY